jgi:hypothetical protein
MTVEIARAARLWREQREIERTADCAQRYLEELCEKKAFEEVRTILRNVQTYLDETIEVLEEESWQRSLHGIDDADA